MQYKINPRNGDKLSILGYGCMRLGRNEAESEKLVITAIEQGVNYFDTAYIYPRNEELLGRILAKGYRDRVKIATKLPPYLVKKPEDMERIFQTELARLQTDHIDYYFMHMLPNISDWQRMCSLGMLEWIAEKKASGQIRNVGFSYHGGVAEFKALCDAYDWEFCMLQYNYFDEQNQAGREGVQYAAARNIPVMIMEPLRGGRLANLPAQAQKVFDQSPVRRSPAEWALRWLWNQPEPLVVLSGMTSMAVLEENLRVASEMQEATLTQAELGYYNEVRKMLLDKLRVPCTGCNYCMPCPQGVDIPLCFSSANDMEMMNKPQAWFFYLLRTYGHNASRCNQCGRCEKHCPQAIPIRRSLAETARRMERFPYKPIRFVAGKFMRLK